MGGTAAVGTLKQAVPPMFPNGQSDSDVANDENEVDFLATHPVPGETFEKLLMIPNRNLGLPLRSPELGQLRGMKKTPHINNKKPVM